MQTFAVIDFETTGLSPEQGARPTEVAAVLVRNGKIVDSYQSLMNSGVPVPFTIEELTGISNDMVRGAPKTSTVMREVAKFVGSYPLVAHNAAFDSKFWDAELKRLKQKRQQEFVCSLLLARRVFPAESSHKLSSLADSLGLRTTGHYHRALADAQVTAYLFVQIQRELKQRYQLSGVSLDLMLSIQRVPRSQMTVCVERYR